MGTGAVRYAKRLLLDNCHDSTFQLKMVEGRDWADQLTEALVGLGCIVEDEGDQLTITHPSSG